MAEVVATIKSQSDFCFSRSSGRTLQKLRLFLVRQGANLPAADIEAELLMLIEFARQLDKVARA